MKIAILSFYSGHLDRGTETWTSQIAARLVKHHQVTVFQNGPVNGGNGYRIVSSDLKINWNAKDSRGTLARRFFIDYWSRLIALSTIKFLPILFKEKFDIVIPTSGGWQPALIRLLTWFRGGRIVIVGHAGIGWDDRNNIYSFPDVFVGLSTLAKNWAKRINPLIKTTYIPNGVDLELFSPKGKKALINLEKPIFLVVSALEKEKRLELAVKAVAKLRRGGLLVLGKGYEESKIKSLGEEFLKGRFSIKTVPFNEISNYYRAIDVFSLPSMPSYSFEMVLLEAMACNLAVVVNDDSIRREIVGGAGIFIDPTDSDAYAKALVKALETNWGNKPRKQAEKFSWDKVVRQYENLFKKLDG